MVSASARADDTPAAAYARHSTTITLSTELSPLATVANRAEIGGAVRLHRRHVAVEGRAGIAFAASTLGFGWLVGGHGGVAAGASFPLGGRIAVTPMAAYDLYVYAPSGEGSIVVHRATVALPVSVILYPHVVIEGVVEVGAAFVERSPELAISFGPRLGLVL